MYDIAIIGAGINGTSVAHEFLKENKSVILFDMEGVAHGGSGAAGAFVSPKFSKYGELKELLQDAFIYSMEFYEKNFPQHFTKTQLIHIAKDEKDGESLRFYKQNTTLKLKEIDNTYDKETISLDTAIIDAKPMCEALADGAKFVKQKVQTLEYDDGMWIIDEIYTAKDLVIATGAYENLIKEPYIKLAGVWGHRIDIKTSTKNNFSLHQYVSISPTNDGVLAIGATHDVHYHPQTATKPYDIEKGRAELLEKASKTIKLEDVEVIKDYTGLRSGSYDYMPLVGELVISNETLACKDIGLGMKKQDYEKYIYYPNLYMINGNGGYGFVLAPYLAKILKDKILNDKKVSDRISPARFFARWARRR
ncbi:MAG: FAD-dependent oxidoreductase [Campylobacterota bacterium]|nr:FAD-dependent oxidoreductase [Campylobacterota bacterium]